MEFCRSDHALGKSPSNSSYPRSSTDTSSSSSSSHSSALPSSSTDTSSSGNEDTPDLFSSRGMSNMELLKMVDFKSHTLPGFQPALYYGICVCCATCKESKNDCSSWFSRQLHRSHGALGPHRNGVETCAFGSKHDEPSVLRPGKRPAENLPTRKPKKHFRTPDTTLSQKKILRTKAPVSKNKNTSDSRGSDGCIYMVKCSSLGAKDCRAKVSTPMNPKFTNRDDGIQNTGMKKTKNRQSKCMDEESSDSMDVMSNSEAKNYMRKYVNKRVRGYKTKALDPFKIDGGNDKNISRFISKKVKNCSAKAPTCRDVETSSSTDTSDSDHDMRDTFTRPKFRHGKAKAPAFRFEETTDSSDQDMSKSSSKDTREGGKMDRRTNMRLNSNTVDKAQDSNENLDMPMAAQFHTDEVMEIARNELPLLTGFREQLEAELEREFDSQELEKLLIEINKRDPVLRLVQTRRRSVQVPTKKPGFSYLDYFPDFAKTLEDARGKEEKLKQLRGFFLWLQHSCNPDAFQPWGDPEVGKSGDVDCFEVEGPDCDVDTPDCEIIQMTTTIKTDTNAAENVKHRLRRKQALTRHGQENAGSRIPDTKIKVEA